jgi:hypothetical protein
MVNMLSNYVNKTVLVSIPFVFKDGDPCACRLLAVEPAGLWLESAELREKMLPNADRRPKAAVFVPFAQMAYLIEDIPAPPPAEHLQHEGHQHEGHKTRAESSVKKRR